MGLISPTEGGSIGAFGALLIGVVLRKVNWRVSNESLRETVKLTAMIMLIIVGS
jgi:TRAP-type mannitol/chloroaromatic compound transport system permease large subunit